MGNADETLFLRILLLMTMKTIAFDLDGTLIDISERDFRIYADILTELGYKPIEKKQYWPLRREKTDIHSILALSACTADKDVAYFLNSRAKRMEESSYLSLDTLFDDVLPAFSKLKENRKMSTFTANMLKEARKKANMTQGDAAKLMGVAVSRIRDLESDRRPVTADEMVQFSRIYDVDVRELLFMEYMEEGEERRLFSKYKSFLKLLEQLSDREVEDVYWVMKMKIDGKI